MNKTWLVIIKIDSPGNLDFEVFDEKCYSSRNVFNQMQNLRSKNPNCIPECSLGKKIESYIVISYTGCLFRGPHMCASFSACTHKLA